MQLTAKFCLMLVGVCSALLGQSAQGLAQDLAVAQQRVTPRDADQAARVLAVTAPTTYFLTPEAFEANSAGAATVPARATADGFKAPMANLDAALGLDFIAGQALFRKIWVAAPASTLASDGLGPLFNARSCEACHIGAGRSHPVASNAPHAPGLVLRIAVPDLAPDPVGINAHLAHPDAAAVATRPHPIYGAQLQDFSTQGQLAEYRLNVRYQDITVALSGGETVTLHQPTYQPSALGYGPLGEVMISPRVAPQMIGLGLLEAIAPGDILARADPEDVNGDGISGRAQIVGSAQTAHPQLGRFGHKAGAASLRDQTALAFHNDIGISTPVFVAGAADCTVAQTACQSAPNGNTGTPERVEIGTPGLDLVTFYARNLAVPARRDVAAPKVLRGKELFYQSGCTTCHTPKFVTQTLPDQPAHSFQLIWPYADLLLHDMGPGLADGFAEGVANGREWRTAPLWGIGLTAMVSGRQSYLHDGRARSLLEAVMWHGGEAELSKTRVQQMPPADRADLIRFLESL